MSYRIEQRMGCPAPSTVIWSVLGDLERWPEWNPLYPEVSGQLRIGEKLQLTEAFAGSAKKVIRPTVVDWVPNSQILWSLKEAGGFIKRLRYIEIDAYDDDDTACIVSNGEIYDGMIGRGVGKRERKRLRAGFQAFNEAVVERVRRVVAGEVKASKP